MDNMASCLQIVYRKFPPELILNSFCKKSLDNISYNNINRDLFVNYALGEFKQYSEDEILNIFNRLKFCMSYIGTTNTYVKNNSSIFNVLLCYGKELLLKVNDEPICRFMQLLKWRSISHCLDQDIFTTSFLANEDILSGENRSFFAWNPIISTDNNELKKIMDKGLAENHFHLKGSSTVFSLSWISLMNDITNREQDFIEAKIQNKRLDPDFDFAQSIPKTDFPSLVKKAAVIRVFLFSILVKTKFLEKIIGDDKGAVNSFLCTIFTDNKMLNTYLPDIQSEINQYKELYGYKVNTHSIDYCIPNNINPQNINGNILLTGERWFLFSMFSKIFINDDLVLEYADLFYAYLVIKAKFRSELIQNNDRVGFKNFADYQDRKGIFFDKDPILKTAVFFTALSSTIKNQKIQKLEARIVPKNNENEISENISTIDEIVSGDNVNSIYLNNDANVKEQMKELTKKYFYVLHFQKEKENYFEKVFDDIKPRNSEKRKEVKIQSIAIGSLRKSMKSAASRIYGIDACANEIGCRPEVFAQSFRYLKKQEIPKKYNIEPNIPNLQATFHVGEDFLDIIDGLRAIDEVINFLDFTTGDRLGHALVLGIDVNDWYKFKRNILVLPKQDCLDNIVWMLSKITEFHIECSEELILKLKQVYKELFTEIYLMNFPEDKSSINYEYDLYFEAWKLRGNDPYLYENGTYQEKHSIDTWDEYAVNKGFLTEDMLKNNPISAYLFYSYHFNPNAKITGSETYEFSVNVEYINVVSAIQHKMLELVFEKKIGIETNPTSNVLIGTFKRYDKHPILNFYSLKSSVNEKPGDLFKYLVSINTDDQGVFDTYLENEYALMAVALHKSGLSKNKQKTIYKWLDKVRDMGIQQCFMK